MFLKIHSVQGNSAQGNPSDITGSFVFICFEINWLFLNHSFRTEVYNLKQSSQENCCMLSLKC